MPMTCFIREWSCCLCWLAANTDWSSLCFAIKSNTATPKLLQTECVSLWLTCFVFQIVSASSFQLLEQLVWHFFKMYFLQADDEHSDWPGPEPGLSVMQLTDEEIDPEISFSQVSWWRLGLNSKPVIAAPCWTSSQKVSRATSQIWHQETEVPGSCRCVCLVFFPLLVSYHTWLIWQRFQEAVAWEPIQLYWRTASR